jgi:hypothetical protein
MTSNDERSFASDLRVPSVGAMLLYEGCHCHERMSMVRGLQNEEDNWLYETLDALA